MRGFAFLVRQVFTVVILILGVVSIVLLAVTLVDRLGLTLNLVLGLIAGVVGFLIGAYSLYLVRGLRKLSAGSPRVLLSYPVEAKQAAEKVREALRGAEAKVWPEIERVDVGETVTPFLEDAISSMDSFVVLLPETPSEYLEQELKVAKRYKLKIIPVISKPGEVAELPTELQGLHPINLTEDEQKGLEELVKAAT